MSMNKLVDRIHWVNDTDPAINETHLNQMDSELDALDDRVIELEGACEAQAEEAEAWAVGERAGSPVDDEDPAYNNNAKYYAGIADAAQQTAVSAKDDAVTAKNTSVSNALASEGYAKGTQNGTPVTSESPYYHNNAEYFKNQASAIVGDKVDSFNGRTGIVVPEDGDYMNIENAIVVNLIPEADSTTVNGIAFTVNDDGSVTINGTATANTGLYFVQTVAGQSGYVQTLENGKYTLHGVPNDLPSGCYLEVRWADGDGASKNANTSNSTPSVTFTFGGHGNTGSGDTYIRFRVENGSTFDNVTIYPMLEVGEIAHDFVGYVGGKNKLNEVVRGKANASHEHSASDITGGTFGGDVSAPATNSYTTATIANIVATDTAPTEGALSTYPNKTLVVVYS